MHQYRDPREADGDVTVISSSASELATHKAQQVKLIALMFASCGKKLFSGNQMQSMNLPNPTYNNHRKRQMVLREIPQYGTKMMEAWVQLDQKIEYYHLNLLRNI